MKPHEVWYDGVVRWFDNKSGEGFIRIGETSVYVHWSAVANGIKNCPESCFRKPKNLWCVLFPKQKVKVQIIEDYNWRQISAVKGS